VVDYVQQANWTQTDIDRAIIGTAKNYENPIRPKEAAKNALHRHLTGQTKEGREANFQQILSATAKDVRSTTLELLETNLKNSSICVVSSREKLKEANRQMTGKKLSIEDIL
jgi:Zn-dependent M16 (insulinase) family peptidase